MATARRLMLTALLIIGVARAAPASSDEPAATNAPAAATTADISVVDDSLPGFHNENSSSSELIVGHGTLSSGDDLAIVADRIRRRHEYLASLQLMSNLRRPESDSSVMTRNGRSDADIGTGTPYEPLSLSYHGPLVAVGVVPYSFSPLGYVSAPGPYAAPPSESMFRQAPSFPFQVQWPLAPYFPVLIKDPFLTFLHGGSWNNLVEYGQAADVCSHRRFRNSPWPRLESNDDDEEPAFKIWKPSLKRRRGRSFAKRAVSQATPLFNSLAAAPQKEKKINKIKHHKTKPVSSEEHEPNEKNGASVNEKNGDLRFPFGGFDWFGNKKPVAPSPGFFINRLKVRRGGVAIAGPGGVATAGRGGTAVVGPGGLAYTQPGGLAVAGPHSRVLALSADADLDALAERVRTRLANGSPPAPDPQADFVATGPIVYYHNESRSSA